jgi:hypothetical protein
MDDPNPMSMGAFSEKHSIFERVSLPCAGKAFIEKTGYE